MKTYTAEQLAEIIEKHRKWVFDEEGGERANLSYADLSYANLSSADLSSANLSYANLSSADLRSADLSSADLSYANLSYANLSSADLRSADLRSANLSYADLVDARSLWGCIGNLSEVKSVQCDTYEVTYTADKLQIGCQFHAIEEWWGFSDEEISLMDFGAMEWWAIWKPILRMIIEASPAKAIEEQPK